MSRTCEPRLAAERLMRWYPYEWRARYGDEFSELLTSEIAERPRSLRRSMDVAVGGLTARFAAMGLTGRTVKPLEQPRRSLATFGVAVAAFMTFAVSMWSQLNIAQRWAEPAAPATHTAIVTMTVALLSAITVAVLGGLPIAGQAALALTRRPTPGLRRAALLFFSGAAVLVAGGLYFRNGWAGPGTHPWAHHTSGLSGVIDFMWASTLPVSAYWAHPTILLSFPTSEIAWMAISPVALVAAITGAARTVRRINLSRRQLRFASFTARGASAAFGLFVFGTLIWLIDGGSGPNNLFKPGTVDLIGLVVMTSALALAVRAANRIAYGAPAT